MSICDNANSYWRCVCCHSPYRGQGLGRQLDWEGKQETANLFDMGLTRVARCLVFSLFCDQQQITSVSLTRSNG
jgi:hypothetical protein